MNHYALVISTRFNIWRDVMAYNEKLAKRIRLQLSDRTDVVERKMFGGLAFMVRGHMCCGVVGDELMVRVGVEYYEAALKEKHAREMDFTGKPLRGMVYVAAPGLASAKQLGKWVERGLQFTLNLPEKK
jgi:TfoX/Sxy family transcriptional regulator of competence genes